MCMEPDLAFIRFHIILTSCCMVCLRWPGHSSGVATAPAHAYARPLCAPHTTERPVTVGLHMAGDVLAPMPVAPLCVAGGSTI